MNLIEFIGFIISLAAVTFLFIKKMLEDRQRRRNPEEYARREALQQENLQRFLKSAGLNPTEDRKRREAFEDDDDEEIEIEREQVRKAKGSERYLPKAPPKPPSQPAYAFKPTEHYEVIRTESVSTAGKTLKSLKSPREMLIIKEIFDKPLSMREK